MSILTEALPDSVCIGGVSYEINTDFRVWLEFDRFIRCGAPVEDATRIFKTCYKRLPASASEALFALVRFWARVDKQKEETAAARGDTGGRAHFDFEEDAEAVYAAFLSEYGIDLLKADMHWHVFLSLFCSLSENCKMMKIISWRACDVSGIKNKEEKKFIKKMQRVYKLPDRRTVHEKDADFADMLWRQ